MAKKTKTTAKKKKTTSKRKNVSKIPCPECGKKFKHLANHLWEEHEIDPDTFSGELFHPSLKDVFLSSIEERIRPTEENLQIDFGGHGVTVNPDVTAEACLPGIEYYRVPRYGKLAEDITSSLHGMLFRRHMYIYGMPGSGKDAFIHAFCSLTRSPSLMFQIQPGVDIRPWLFTRGFTQEGTEWEEGLLLKAVRDGYKSPHTGKIYPYRILITDFDRADKNQAEILRLLMDSTMGRIAGPDGSSYPVLPGTQIVCTGNTAGSGDTRGRCISAKPVDASIWDRFERVYKFHWMDWKDEGEVCKDKFPVLMKYCPKIFKTIGRCVEVIRTDIEADKLFSELSHRAVCSWLGQAEDMVVASGKVTETLLKDSLRVILHRQPDDNTALAISRLIDPYLKDGVVDTDVELEEESIQF